MQLRILQASTFALDNLNKASVLTVHSVYHKAVNLRTDNQILTLQPRDSVLSPVSLITDYTEEMLAHFYGRPTADFPSKYQSYLLPGSVFTSFWLRDSAVFFASLRPGYQNP